MDSVSINRKKRRKKIIIVCLVLVIAVVLMKVFFFRSPKTVSNEQTVVRTVTLTKQDFQNTISAEGKVESQSATNVTTTLTYKVESVAVEVGDYVNEGDTIVTLDKSELQKQISRLEESNAEQLKELEKNVQNAFDGKENAWADLKSAEESGADTTQAERQFASANGQYFDAVEKLNAGVSSDELDDLYENLNDCTVKAESSGTITSLNATVGSSANSSVIATISDINHLETTVTVDEYDIQSIKKGMKAIVSTDAVDASFSATVTAVSLAASTSSNTSGFEVKVSLDEATDQLLIGMNVKVSIILEEENDVYTVPIDAVETDENGNSVVYVQQEDGTFEPVTVTTGSTSDYYVVISGDNLQEGMVIRASANETEAEVSSSDIEFGGDFSVPMGGGGGGNMPMNMPGGGQ